VMRKVGSFLRRRPNPRYVLKIPRGVTIGNEFWTVQSELNPVTFTQEKQAKSFARLLSKSTNRLRSVIVRREVTDEGYHPTYGDNENVKEN
jgi:hypothetical protein